jgi:hypothetical protein
MWFVAELSTRRAGFDRGPGYVGYVVDEVAMGKVFLQVLTFSFCQYNFTNVPVIFILMLLFLVKQVGKGLETPNHVHTGNNRQRIFMFAPCINDN